MAGGTWRVACCLFRMGGGHGGYFFFRICDANRDWFFCTAFSAAISAWLPASHPNSEVQQVRAGVVLRWGTTREGPVLRFSFLLLFLFECFPPFPRALLAFKCLGCRPPRRVPFLRTGGTEAHSSALLEVWTRQGVVETRLYRKLGSRNLLFCSSFLHALPLFLGAS